MADGWRVVSQRQTEELTPDGRFVPVVEIHFQLDSGETGRVDVPLNLHTSDYVRQAIEDRVANMTAVRDL